MTTHVNNFGVEIEMSVKATTPVVRESTKPLLLLGPAKTIIDPYDSDGLLDSDALLTGPAYALGSYKTPTEWASGVKQKTFSLILNNVQADTTFANKAYTIAQIVATLNTGFAASGTFGGVTVGYKSRVQAGETQYALTIRSVTLGNSVTMKVTGAHATNFGFTAGVTYRGFGNYAEQTVIVPFVSLPDPSGYLPTAVLETDTIGVLVNAGGTGIELSTSEAWERNAKQRTTWKSLHSVYWTTEELTAVAALTDYSPWHKLAAVEVAPTLRAWDPKGVSAFKFWGRGRDSSGIIPALVDDAEKYATATAVGGDSATNPTLMGINAGDKGNGWRIVLTLEAEADSVTVTVGTKLIEVTMNNAGVTHTIAHLADLINDDATASKYVTLATESTDVMTASGTFYIGGGYAPVNFGTALGAAEGYCRVVGNLMVTVATTLPANKEMVISVDGKALTTFSTTADFTVADLIAEIDAQFGANTAMVVGPSDLTSEIGDGSPGFFCLKSATKGFRGVVYIESMDDALAEALFLNHNQAAKITSGGSYIGTNHMCYVKMASQASGSSFSIAPGDVVKQGATSVTVAYVGTAVEYEADKYALPVYFTAPLAAVLGDDDDAVTIEQQIGVADFIGKHQGKFMPCQQADMLWDTGAVQSSVNSFGHIKDDAGNDAFENSYVELVDPYTVNKTFAGWYMRYTGLQENVAARPDPELYVDATTEALTIRNDSIVDIYGRTYNSPPFTMYAGYTALRQDITAANRKTVETISSATELTTKLGPITPANPLGYAAMLAFAAAGGDTVIKVLGVASDNLTGYMGAVPILNKDDFWMAIPLTENEDITDWMASYVKVKSEPTEKKEIVSLVSCEIPTEAYPTTMGSGLSAVDNLAGAQEVLKVDPTKLLLGQALVPYLDDIGVGTVDEITSDHGVYVKINGGGATDVEAAKKYLVVSVDVAANEITVADDDELYDSDSGYYSIEDPPLVVNANLNVSLRGAEITSETAVLTALQSRSDGIGSRRVCLCPSDGCDVTYSSQQTRVSGYFGVAASGGYIQAHDVEFPISGYEIPGIDQVYGTDDSFTDIDGIPGLFFLVNGDSGVEVGRSFTTDTSEVKNHEFSVTSQLDSLARRVRQALRGWKKKNVGNALINEQYLKTSAAIQKCRASREISSADIEAIQQSETETNAHEILLTAVPFIPCGVVYVYIQV